MRSTLYDEYISDLLFKLHSSDTTTGADQPCRGKFLKRLKIGNYSIFDG